MSYMSIDEYIATLSDEEYCEIMMEAYIDEIAAAELGM